MFVVGLFALLVPIGAYSSYKDYLAFEKVKEIEKVRVVDIKNTTSHVGKQRFFFVLVNSKDSVWEYDYLPEYLFHVGDTLSIVYDRNKPSEFYLAKEYGTNHMEMIIIAIVLDSFYLWLIIMVSIKSQRKKVVNFFNNYVHWG